MNLDPEQFADVIANAIRVATAPLAKRLSTLERRCVQLETKAVLTDAGVWDESKMYKPGDVVSFQGSGWTAQLCQKGQRPSASSAWRLFIKRGRDGKDAR